MSAYRVNFSSFSGFLLAMLGFVMLTFVGLGTAGAQTSPWAAGESAPEDLVISLATFSPGDSIESWFGHSGIVVEDRRHNVGRLYNYGMFNFDRDMLLRFAMGRLWFWVAPTSVSGTYQFYMQMDRDVRVLELNIPPEKRLEIAEYLAENIQPENREYLYHHYEDNCSTRLRDIIDLAVDGQFSKALREAPGRYTLREHTRRHSGHFAPMDWLLMFLMNGSIDHPSTVWAEMFLPEELERQILSFDWVDEEGNRQPLVLRSHVIYESEDRAPVPDDPPTHWPYWLALGLFLGTLGVLIGGRARRRPGRGSRVLYGLYMGMVGFFMGIPGLVLGAMAVATDHTVTYWNQNLFWANPATFLVFFLALGVLLARQKARQWMVILWTGLAGLALIGMVFQLVGFVVPALYQDTWLPMLLLVPIVAGATLGAWLVDGRLVRGN